LKTTLFDFNLFPLSEPSDIQKRLKGSNKKRVFIVVNWEEGTEVLEPFLSKVLAAAQIGLYEDVLLLSITPDEHIGLHPLLSDNEIHHVLIFGPYLQQLGLNFRAMPYQPVKIEDRIFLQTDSLKAIFEERQSGGKEKAGALWKNLKSLFLKS
jgi:hypothetical protein